MTRNKSEFWVKARDDAHLVCEALVRASQMIRNDQSGALACVQDALNALASLRSRATESSALLGVVLYFGIELEVRLGGLTGLPKSALETAIADELARSRRLLDAIENHLELD